MLLVRTDLLSEAPRLLVSSTVFMYALDLDTAFHVPLRVRLRSSRGTAVHRSAERSPAVPLAVSPRTLMQ